MELEKEYDYLVIGGGCGGSFTAKYLSDNNVNTVGLFEFGPNNDNNKVISDPTLFNINEQIDICQEKYTYQWNTIPEPGINNRILKYLNSCQLGGNTSLNGLQCARSTEQYHESIAKFVKSDLFKWPNVLKSYIDNEKYTGTTQNKEARGYNGIYEIRQAPIEPTNATKEITTTYSEILGLPLINDINSGPDNKPIPNAVFQKWSLSQTDEKTRNSCSRVYITRYTKQIDENTLQGIDGRKLTVYLRALVSHVEFDDNKYVKGIHVLQNDKKIFYKVRKAVFVCGGSNSPAILQRSGIGDEELLKKLDIPVIFANSNVGEHHLDSHMINIPMYTPNNLLPNDDLQSMYCGGCFLPDTRQNAEFKRGYMLDLVPAVLNWRPQVPVTENQDILLLTLLQLRPESEGWIKITSKDPRVPPQVFQNILGSPEDLESLKIGIQEYIVKPIDALITKYPGKYDYCAVTRDILTDMTPGGKLEQFIKNYTYNCFHYCGSCRMGPDAKTGVVDEKGRVFGVGGLYVCDATILPTQPDSTLTLAILATISIILKNLQN